MKHDVLKQTQYRVTCLKHTALTNCASLFSLWKLFPQNKRHVSTVYCSFWVTISVFAFGNSLRIFNRLEKWIGDGGNDQKFLRNFAAFAWWRLNWRSVIVHSTDKRNDGSDMQHMSPFWLATNDLPLVFSCNQIAAARESWKASVNVCIKSFDASDKSLLLRTFFFLPDLKLVSIDGSSQLVGRY